MTECSDADTRPARMGVMHCPYSDSDLECCDADAEMLACQRHCGGCASRDIMHIALPYP
jgi:hypothetical protein